MHNQISSDRDYGYIRTSFKYKPAYDLDNRDELIESKKDSMDKLIQKLAESYKVVRDYSA